MIACKEGDPRTSTSNVSVSIMEVPKQQKPEQSGQALLLISLTELMPTSKTADKEVQHVLPPLDNSE